MRTIKKQTIPITYLSISSSLRPRPPPPNNMERVVGGGGRRRWKDGKDENRDKLLGGGIGGCYEVVD
jgi:hypothetical protein